MRLSKLQKLNPSTIGKCAMVFVPPWNIRKGGGGFHYCQSRYLRSLQRCGAFVVAFTSEKWKM